MLMSVSTMVGRKCAWRSPRNPAANIAAASLASKMNSGECEVEANGAAGALKGRGDVSDAMAALVELDDLAELAGRDFAIDLTHNMSANSSPSPRMRRSAIAAYSGLSSIPMQSRCN